MSVLESSIRRLTWLPLGWRAAAGAISMLWIATALGAGIAFLTQALLAHELGPEFYGLFASSLAMVSIIAPLAGFGVSQFWLKVYGAEGWGAHRWLHSSLKFLAGTTVLTLSLITLWAFTGAPRDASLTLLLLLPVVVGLLAAALMSTRLRLEERHYALSLWQLTMPSGRLLVALTLLLMVPGMAAVHVAAAGYGVAALVVALLAASPVRAMLRGDMGLRGHGPRPARDGEVASPGAWSVWSQAWAFGLAAVLYPIFFQISTVLLKYLDGNVAAGIFGIALAVMSAIYLIPVTLYQKFLLSKLHRWAIHDKPKFWLVYRHGNLAMLASGTILGIVVALLAPWFVPLAFGEKYRAVVPVLLVLSVCIPLRFLSTGLGAALLNERHMRFRVFAMGLSAVVVVLFNLVLIPTWHVMGAVAATVVGEAVLLLSFHLGVRHFHGDREATS